MSPSCILSRHHSSRLPPDGWRVLGRSSSAAGGVGARSLLGWTLPIGQVQGGFGWGGVAGCEMFGEMIWYMEDTRRMVGDVFMCIWEVGMSRMHQWSSNKWLQISLTLQWNIGETMVKFVLTFLGSRCGWDLDSFFRRGNWGNYWTSTVGLHVRLWQIFFRLMTYE